MGFFDKLKKINIFSGFGSELTDDFYDGLEESLILADTGMDVTLELVEELRRRVKSEGVKTMEGAREVMVQVIADALSAGDLSLDLSTKPSVVLFIGVNGVGKTTTTVNITAALHDLGKRVLLCDFDPQANATSGMGVDKNTASPNIYDVLVSEADPVKAVVSTRYGDVLPSSKGLAGAGVEMVGIQDREHLLRRALEKLAPKYDYILRGLPALPGAADAERPLRRQQRPGSGSERVLRPGGAQRSDVHHPGCPALPESGAGAGGGAHDHVRQPDQPGAPGGPGGQAVLPRQGLQHRHPPERAAERGAQPRKAHLRLRPRLPGL